MLTSVLYRLTILSVSAQDFLCEGVEGCEVPGSGAEVPIYKLIVDLIDLFTFTVGGFAVFMIIVGGIQMVTSFGDESKTTKGRGTVIAAIMGFLLVFFAQLIVGLITGEFRELVQTVPDEELGPLLVIARAVRIVVSFLNPIFFIIIVFAGYRMLFSGGKPDQFTKGRTMLTWAIIGAMIVNLAPAIIRAALNLIP